MGFLDRLFTCFCGHLLLGSSNLRFELRLHFSAHVSLDLLPQRRDQLGVLADSQLKDVPVVHLDHQVRECIPLPLPAASIVLHELCPNCRDLFLDRRLELPRVMHT